MSQEAKNHIQPNEIEFSLSSEKIKFESFIGDPNDNQSLNAQFMWICASCGWKNHDCKIIQPHSTFYSSWHCQNCKQLTTVHFPEKCRGFWVTLTRSGNYT